MEMNNEIGSKSDLAKYRLETAANDIHSAEILFAANEYRAANNRAYYAIYHAISAIHALDGNQYKRHKDAIGVFNREYVKTGIFPRDLGRKVAQAEEIRHASDYDDFYVANLDETKEQIEIAKEFVENVKNYCENQMAIE